uniref:ANK_REP_REGION domain-containing protein n=1 Tax=Strongyloides papillosus TaxID=174720 RepID=A0A0N5BJB6_STREA
MYGNFTTNTVSASDCMVFPEFLDHTPCYNIINNSRSCGIKDIVYSGNTIEVDGNNKKHLLSWCNGLFESSFLSYFIRRDYKKSIVFEDPLRINDIFGFSVATETKVSDLLCDHKSLLETAHPMTSINNFGGNPAGDRDFYEKICSVILLEDHQGFEELLRIPSLGSIMHAKDLQGRSILTLVCMMDKPRIAELLVKKGLSIDDKDKLGRTALYWAVRCDSIKVLKWMLNQLPVTEDFILSKDGQGITSLHLAATKTSSKILCLLLDALPNKSVYLLRKLFDVYNRIPIHYAAASGSLECVERLMDEDLSLPVSIRDMYGNTPLMLACGNNSASDVVRYLSTNKSISATSRNSCGMSPLHIAVLANNIEGVKILLEECKMPTEIYDEDSRTPLHYAAQNGRLEIVELLLKNGAKYDACDKYRATPLHYAAEISWPIVISLVTKSPCNYCRMTDKEGRTPFMWAVASENEEVVSGMLKTFDIPRHGEDNHRYTPLHLAAFAGNLSICKILLLQGWTVTAEDKAGATPLHIAAGKGFTDIVEVCCTSNDILVKIDTNHRTALFYAALGGQAYTLDVMISNFGFDKMAEDILDRTVLHVAAYCGFVNCVKKLIDLGVEINASDKDEETPLHLACYRGKEDVVHLLVNSGATINRYSRVYETTPLCYAIANKHTDLIEYLRNRDAVTGGEIKDLAASIITRAIRGFVVKKRQCLLGAPSGGTTHFPEQSSQNKGSLPNQRVYTNNSLGFATGSLASSQFIGTPIPTRRSSYSSDSHIYIDGTLIDIFDA